MPIFRVKSVKIYTGQKKFTQICSWGSWQISGMPLPTPNATMRQLLGNFWDNIGDNFDIFLGQLFYNFGTTLRQVWDNFETTCRQLWDNFGTTWWLFLVTIGGAYLEKSNSLYGIYYQKIIMTSICNEAGQENNIHIWWQYEGLNRNECWSQWEHAWIHSNALLGQ